MRPEDVKKDKLELPVDYNGNAAQIIWLGGRTQNVSGQFTAETTVLRLANTGDAVATIKLMNVDLKGKTDDGTPILPGSVEYFGCYLGDIFEVDGTLAVTFLRDVSLKAPYTSSVFTESNFDQDAEKISGPQAVVTKDVPSKTLTYSGNIYYDWNMQGHMVGIDITPTVNLSNFEDVRVTIIDQYSPRVYGKEILSDGKLSVKFKVEEVPTIDFMVEIKWDENNTETFYVKIDKDTKLV